MTVLIKRSGHSALTNVGDYRVLLTSVSHGGPISGSDGDVILDLMNHRIVKYTAVDVLYFPLEQNVVYFDQSANQLLMWTGVEVVAIGSVTTVSGAAVDVWNTGTYVIATDITTTLSPAQHSALIFEGGVLQAGLIGNQTVIQAPPMRIFGINCQVSGSFVTQEAYPEWWGALPSPDKVHVSSPLDNDCSTAIQAAFDSCFGVIRFCAGFYYISRTLELKKMKTIRMMGLGLRDNITSGNDFTTVIWTEQNINVLEVNIPYQETLKGRLLIEGGEINVRACSSDAVMPQSETGNCYASNAITVYATGMIGGKINTSLVGPIDYVGVKNVGEEPNVIQEVDWEHSNCHRPTLQEVSTYNYKGTGIRFTDVGETVVHPNLYLFHVEGTIVGFGKGIAVKYDSDYADMTSLHVNCFLDQCFIYVNAPSRAFNGGKLEGSIQTRSFNGHYNGTGFLQALIIGDFSEAYINPRIWDASTDIDLFHFTKNKDVRFGQIAIEVMKSHYRRMGMPVEKLATIVSDEQSCLLGSMGHHDLQQLSAVNTVMQSDNFIHFIDNDLLSIDRIIQGSSFTVDHGNTLHDFKILNNSSPFDRTGLCVQFSNTTDDPDAYLSIMCDLRRAVTGLDESTKLQILTIHLKNAGFKHFQRLLVFIDGNQFYGGEYAKIPLVYSLNDIVIPLLNRINYDTNDPFYGKDQFKLGHLELYFEGLVIEGDNDRPLSNVWGNECFKVAIEGHFNRRAKNNIWSASGGELGNHINRFGKPYIIGTKSYNESQAISYDTLQSLPSNASIGAMGVVADTYPVVNTTQGWVVQNLIGTLSQIQSIMSSIGTFSVGQTAVATNLNKMIWWTGSSWKDAMGNIVS